MSAPRVHIHAGKDGITITIGERFVLVIDSEPADVGEVVEQAIAKLDEPAAEAPAIEVDASAGPVVVDLPPISEKRWPWRDSAPPECTDPESCKVLRGCAHQCGAFPADDESPL